MNGPHELFLWLVGRVLDGEATEAERGTFRALLREHPELIDEYRRQTDMDTLICWKFGRAADKTAPQTPVKSRMLRDGAERKCGGWRKAAAAAVAVLAGAGLLFALRSHSPLPRSPLRAACAPHAGVRLVSHSGMAELVLPDTLPGALRLAAGEAVVRLKSGVRLTLLGPAAVKIRDGLQVELECGRLLADVPPVATGFIVRTETLEMWDLGTVFGVSVSNGVSDVFVFKGWVQVNEASGEAVDLCRTGEGVRAAAGKTALKVAADWPEARRLFAPVEGAAALAEPAAAFAAAGRIAELWEERYLPEEAWRIRERAMRLAASLAAPARVPFSKSAWVRPSAPARQEGNMKTTHLAAALSAAAVLTGTSSAEGTSAPIRIDTSPCHNRHWTTVFTNEVPLRWEWPAAAVSAALSITGMGGAFATNFTEAAAGYLWRVFPGSAPAAEDVYELTLTFKDGGGGTVATQGSRLAVVAAAFGQTAVDPGPSDRRWSQVKDNAVIPYDAGWTAATAGAAATRLAIEKAGGATQENLLPDAAGYFGWKLKNSGWGYGTFALSLTFPATEGEWDAVLTHVPSGTMISLR
jgi:ferric-dicitrate binding protein FerR (iron transport regulator)